MNIFRHALQPRGLLVAMHLPFVVFSAARGVTGLGFDSAGDRWSALFLVLVACAIQVHHSLAAADGVSPRYWKLTLFLLFLIAYVPLPLYRDRWPTLNWFVIASALMFLPGRAALIFAVTDAVGMAIWIAVTLAVGRSQIAPAIVYNTTIFLAGGGGL